ncbi:MAG: hypothetical protein U9N54_07430 [candidate division Zixibacteria bacterium]|nr:hypothetical protein [candidate division Zixibacteria bacterium]
MKRPLIILGFVMVLSMLLLSGCNIFGWTSGDSTDSLIDEGNQEMRDGNCAAAVEKFAAAIAKDTLHADARYFHAKATLCAAEFNVLQLGTMMSDSSYNDEESLPFTAGEWKTNYKKLANDLYGAINVVYDDLNPVYYGFTHGTLNSNDIDLEYVVAIGIKALLMFQDTNLDGVIDDDDFDFNIVFNSGSNQFIIDNINEYMNSISPAERDAYFDAYFEAISEVLTEAINIITTIIEDRVGDDGGLDMSEIKSLLNDIKNLSNDHGA